MVTFSYLSAMALLCLSASIFYLGCPNQQWLVKRPISFRSGLWLSLLLLVPSWLLLRLNLSTLSSTFFIATALMLCLGLLPLLTRHDVPQRVGVVSRAKLLTKSKGLYDAPGWWQKPLIGMLLGFPAALSLSGLLAWLGPGGISHGFKTQMVMWLIPLLWLMPLSLVFFSRSYKRLVALYVAGNVFAFALLQGSIHLA